MGVFRLLLALSVMTGHMGRPILGFHQLAGDVAVQCFYMISGFYMALILNEKYTGPHHNTTFWLQRFLRIYPSYLIILAVSALIEGLFPRLAFFGCWKPWLAHFDTLTFFSGASLILSNLLIFGQDWLFFLAVNPLDGTLYLTSHFITEPIPCYQFILVQPAWSLGVECTFYLLAPFLVRQRAGIQVMAVLASLLLRLALSHYFDFTNDPWHYRFFPSQLSFFMTGSLGYLVYRHYGDRIRAFGAGKTWIVWLLWLAVFTYGRLPGHDLRPYYFIPIVAAMIPLLFAVYRDNTWDRAIGELSYPVYLIHPLVLFVFNPFYPFPMHTSEEIVLWPSPLYSITCLISVIALAWLFYRFIEGPMDRYRARLFRRGEKAREHKPN